MKITEEMVKAAVEAMNSPFASLGAESFGDVNTTRYVTRESLDRAKVRFILDSALNPPSEPEITVTDEMIKAGRGQMNLRTLVDQGATSAYVPCNAYVETVVDVYRAMRKLEPAPFKPNATIHHRSREGLIHSHRRKDDPK